jgi:hypothetical protein
VIVCTVLFKKYYNVEKKGKEVGETCDVRRELEIA